MSKLTKDEELSKLKSEVERLQSALSSAETHNEEAAKRAMYFRGDDGEEPTGRKVTVRKAMKPWAKNEDAQDWQDVEVPTFYFKVDMPPIGGVQIMINGESMQHGLTYEVTEDTLKVLKSIVYKLREHEANIHGNDENVYRPKVNARFSGKVGGRIQ